MRQINLIRSVIVAETAGPCGRQRSGVAWRRRRQPGPPLTLTVCQPTHLGQSWKDLSKPITLPSCRPASRSRRPASHRRSNFPLDGRRLTLRPHAITLHAQRTPRSSTTTPRCRHRASCLLAFPCRCHVWLPFATHPSAPSRVRPLHRRIRAGVSYAASRGEGVRARAYSCHASCGMRTCACHWHNHLTITSRD